MSLLKSHHATVQKLPRLAIIGRPEERTKDLWGAAVPTADGRFASCVAPHLARSMHARSTRNCGPANPLQIDRPGSVLTNHTTMAGGGAARGKPQGSARSGRSVLAHPGNEASGQKNDPSGHLPTFCCNCTHTVHGRSLLRSQHCSNRLLDHLRHIIS